MGNLKNLLVYINPEKTLVRDYGLLVKIQIDNSLDLGWKKQDLILVFNYPFEYNGVKAIVVSSKHYCAVRPRSIKTAIVPFLIDKGIIEKGKLYWNHDFDAYQNSKLSEFSLGLDGFDVGLTDYGWRERWCMGSFFLKSTSKNIFEKAKDIIYKNIEDEDAMVSLTQDPAIKKRCKRLNITYNFGMRNVESNYKIAQKPVKVLHFHPHDRRMPNLDIFMHGKNGLNKPIMTRRLIKIFNQNGIK